MDTFVRAADGAQQVRREAERNVDRRQKYQLFLKASKLYLQEIEHTNDDQIRTSLTFLASASMYEAISWSRHGSVNRSDIKSDLPSQRTKSNEENLLLNCERAIENIANKRISGLQQLAKGAEPSASQVVKDILLLEKQLSDIGLNSPANPLPSKKAASKFNSTIGESYMVLNDDPPPSVQTARKASHNPMDFSMISLPQVDNDRVSAHSIESQLPKDERGKANGNNQRADAFSQMQTTPTGILSFWSRTGTSNSLTQSPAVSSNGNNRGKQHSLIDGLAWNEQSIMAPLPPPDDSKAHSQSSPDHASDQPHRTSGHDGSNEDASLLRATIASLRAENESLLAQQNSTMKKMEQFKMEYADKIKEYKKGGSSISSTDTPAVPADVTKSQTTAKPETEQMLQLALRREEKYKKRLQDYDKIVVGLTNKYEALMREGVRKDNIIAKFTAAQASSSSATNDNQMHLSNQNHNQASRQSAPSILLPSSLPQNPSFNNHNFSGEGSGFSAATPREGAASPQRSPQSAGGVQQLQQIPRYTPPSNAMSQFGTVHTYNRRPPHTARHPSTSTLESLQKTPKIPK